jgi:lipoyl synthase
MKETNEGKPKILRKPEWLRIKLPGTDEYAFLKDHLKRHHLHTICESGNCPNMGECWAAGTATFMILGNICTRNCRFCSVEKGNPLPPDADEPNRIANAVRELGIKHCVLTSVTRDDLDDGGAGIWAETIRLIKEIIPGITIEALIPDFHGNETAIQKLIDSNPDVISHNLETVKRLTPLIRIKARYETSLKVIQFLSANGVRTKSGLMLGLGETDDELFESIEDLYNNGCQVLTMGQYLQPTKSNFPVERYINPDRFEEYKAFALSIGFQQVESNPLVRSSYHAEKHIKNSDK